MATTKTTITAEGQAKFEEIVTGVVNHRHYTRQQAASWLISVKGITPQWCSEMMAEI